MLYCISSDIFLQFLYFFFFNDTATTEIYTLSLHDALPISPVTSTGAAAGPFRIQRRRALRERCRLSLAKRRAAPVPSDRKSTRLNSSHSQISYAVFCLKKKNHPSLPLNTYPINEIKCCRSE